MSRSRTARPTPVRRGLTAAAVAGVLTLGAVAPVPAGASAWAPLGGDTGRSGQAGVDAGGTPVLALYARTGATDQDVRTSPLISGGAGPLVQRVVYGTAAGRVHVRVLGTGAPAGIEAGVDIDHGAADPDVLGAAGSSVGVVDSSTPDALGQAFAVHNDTDLDGGTDDISIAQIDETSGLLVQEVPVPGTDGLTIESTPAIAAGATLSDAATLVFVARDAGAGRRLFRVPIAAAGTLGATIGPATSVPVPGATTTASPTLLALRTPGTGTAELYVAIGTSAAASLQTFRASDLLAGPASGALGGAAQTPSVPVTPDGRPPGAAGAIAATAPAIYVAIDTGAATVVRRLVQLDATATLATVASSLPLPGDPSPALATDQDALAGGPASGARVVAATAANLYVLDDGLVSRGALSSLPLAAGTGFGATAPLISGDLVYAVRDDGRPLVLAAKDLQPVAGSDFTAPAANAGATAAVGQPAVSRGITVFATDRGLLAHRNTDVTAPTVTLTAPGPRARVSGTITLAARAADSRGVASVEFRLNTKLVGTATATTSGSPFISPGGEYAVSFDTRTLPSNKTYAYVVTVRDPTGLKVASVTRSIVIINPSERRLKPGRCSNSLKGGAGDDVLNGTTLGDALYGLAGDDLLAGSTGDDCLYGSTGADGLSGGAGTDRLSGSAGEDLLTGGSGRDTLYGGEGRDVLRGQAGSDSLRGESGNDSLDGGIDADRLDGGLGDDSLLGGAGTDTFFAGPGADTVNAVDGRRERVDCGTGRDVARVDRSDRVTRCERVVRVRAASR